MKTLFLLHTKPPHTPSCDLVPSPPFVNPAPCSCLKSQGSRQAQDLDRSAVVCALDYYRHTVQVGHTHTQFGRVEDQQQASRG